MVERSFIRDVRDIVRAVEAGGGDGLARRLPVGAKLRLVSMADEQLRELARIASSPLGIAVEVVYEQFRQVVREHAATVPKASEEEFQAR